MPSGLRNHLVVLCKTPFRGENIGRSGVRLLMLVCRIFVGDYAKVWIDLLLFRDLVIASPHFEAVNGINQLHGHDVNLRVLQIVNRYNWMFYEIDIISIYPNN